MFYPYYPADSYVSASLAEARAAQAEAAARAAEAKYLAEAARQEALRSHLYEPEPFTPDYYPSQFSSGCACHSVDHAYGPSECVCEAPIAPAIPPAFGLYPPHPFGRPGRHHMPPPHFGHHHHRHQPHGFHRGPFPHPHGPHRHHHHHHPPSPSPLESSFKERELEARLAEERAARILAEEGLKQKVRELRARENLARQPPQPTVTELNIKPTPVPTVAPSKAMQTKLASPWAPLNVPVAFSYQPRPTSVPQAPMTFSQQSRTSVPQAPVAKPKAVPAKEPATAFNSASAADVKQIQMLLESLFRVPVDVEAKINQSTNEPSQRPNVATPSSSASKSQNTEIPILEKLKARYSRESEDEVKDTIQAVINALCGEQAPKPTPSQSTSKSSPTSQGSLLEQLKARYENGATEVDDIDRAIINSLSDRSSASPSQNKATTSSNSSPKGKAKDLSDSEGEKSPRTVLDGLQQVNNIANTFHDLEAEFEFPSHIDFVSTTTSLSSDSTAISLLAFTARNHPVRFYEQTLSALLNQLDLIESQGNAELRTKRKEAVNLIEKALEDLENTITGRWRAKVAKEADETKKADDAKQTESTTSSQETSSTNADSSIIPQASETQSTELPSTLPSDEATESTSTSESPSQAVLETASIESPSQPQSEEVVETTKLPFTSPSQSIPEPVADNLDHSPIEDIETQQQVDIVHPESITVKIPISGDAEPVEATPEESEDPHADIEQTGDRDATSIPPSSDVPEIPESNDDDPVDSTATIRPESHSESHLSVTEADDSDDGFLLSQPEDEKVKKSIRPKASVEDLGSDWSDLDA